MRIPCSGFGFVVVVGVLLNASAASAMRCGTHLVREGDLRSRVLQVCGEPTDVSQRIEEHSVRQLVPSTNSPRPVSDVALQTTQDPTTVVSASLTVVVESWTYNFGPDRAMQRVVFYDGVVSQIESLGRGYPPEALGMEGRNVRPGETRDRVRAVWGDPTETSSSVIERASTTRLASANRGDAGGVRSSAPNIAYGARVRVVIETWTYNRGPQRHMRRVVFEDGVVVSVETLGPGF